MRWFKASVGGNVHRDRHRRGSRLGGLALRGPEEHAAHEEALEDQSKGVLELLQDVHDRPSYLCARWRGILHVEPHS